MPHVTAASTYPNSSSSSFLDIVIATAINVFLVILPLLMLLLTLLMVLLPHLLI